MKTETRTDLGLVCPKHGKLMDTRTIPDIHTDGRVTTYALTTYLCGCEFFTPGRGCECPVCGTMRGWDGEGLTCPECDKEFNCRWYDGGRCTCTETMGRVECGEDPNCDDYEEAEQ